MSLHGFREVRTPYVEPTRALRARHRRGDRHRREGDVLLRAPRRAAHAAPRGHGRRRARVRRARASTRSEPVTRWWYMGPMFRAERPQRGRYRQFSQLGRRDLRRRGAGLRRRDDRHARRLPRASSRIPDVEVFVNSLGGPETRARYRDALVALPDAHGRRRCPRSRSAGSRPTPCASSTRRTSATQAAVARRARRCTSSSTRPTASTSTACAAASTRWGRPTPSTPEAGARPRLLHAHPLRDQRRPREARRRQHARRRRPLRRHGRRSRGDRRCRRSASRRGSSGCSSRASVDGRDQRGRRLRGAARRGRRGDRRSSLARDLRRSGIRCEVDTRGSSLKSQLRRANALGRASSRSSWATPSSPRTSCR